MNNLFMLLALMAFSTAATGCQPSAPDEETKKLSDKAKAKKDKVEVIEDEPKAPAKEAPKAKAKEPKADPKPKAPKADDKDVKPMPELKGSWEMSGHRNVTAVDEDVEAKLTGEVTFNKETATFSMKWKSAEGQVSLTGKLEVIEAEGEVRTKFIPTGGRSLAAYEGSSKVTFTWNGETLSGTWKGDLGGKNLGKVILTPPEKAEPKKKK